MVKTNNFFARRTLLGDLEEVRALCLQNRDYSFFTEKTARSVLSLGEGWCCVENGIIVAFCGFVPLSASCELCEACEKTKMFSPRTILLLPICASPTFLGRGRFMEWCYSRANTKNEVICSLLPVKSGTAELILYFSLGFCLFAMRPLHELRPYYIFSRGVMQIARDSGIMVNTADTHSVSKFLEQGFCAVDVKYVDGEKKLELVRLGY